MDMKKTAIVALLTGVLLLAGCAGPTVPTIAPEERAAALIAKADAADAAGDHTAALEDYRAAAQLAPQDTRSLRGQIAALSALDNDAPGLIAAYEELYAADAFENADYLVLGGLYIASGSTAQARDLLEKGQCLAPSERQQALLDTLSVEISSDSVSVQKALAPLLAALTADDTDAAVDALLAPELYDSVCPRLPDGSRRYTAKGADGAVVTLYVAADETGAPEYELWCVNADRALHINLDSAALLVTDAAVKGGSYAGQFSAACFKAANGSAVFDSGTVQNGVVTGEVTTELAAGETAVAALWNARETLARTVYTGTLDADGHTAETQPTGLEAGRVVYAYAEGRAQYVYMLVAEGEDAQDYVFTPASFSLAVLPQ